MIPTSGRGQDQQDTIDQVGGKAQQPGAGTIGDHVAAPEIGDVEGNQPWNGPCPQPCDGHDVAGDQSGQHDPREINLVPGEHMHGSSS